MPNSCSLPAQKRDRTKSQLVKGAVKKRINPMVFKFSHLVSIHLLFFISENKIEFSPLKDPFSLVFETQLTLHQNQVCKETSCFYLLFSQ